MSYNCKKCLKHYTGKPVKVVVETREKIYPPRNWDDRLRKFEDPGGRGFEIVSEQIMCPECAGSRAVPGIQR